MNLANFVRRTNSADRYLTCDAGRDWALDRVGGRALDWREAWETCPRGDWLLWALSQLGGFDQQCVDLCLGTVERVCRVHTLTALRTAGLSDHAQAFKRLSAVTDQATALAAAEAAKRARAAGYFEVKSSAAYEAAQAANAAEEAARAAAKVAAGSYPFRIHCAVLARAHAHQRRLYRSPPNYRIAAEACPVRYSRLLSEPLRQAPIAAYRAATEGPHWAAEEAEHKYLADLVRATVNWDDVERRIRAL